MYLVLQRYRREMGNYLRRQKRLEDLSVSELCTAALCSCETLFLWIRGHHSVGENCLIIETDQAYICAVSRVLETSRLKIVRSKAAC